MLFAALLVIPVIIVEQADVGEPWSQVANVTNWIIWLAFATELVVMLIVVPRRGAWLRAHPLEVIIVVLTPPVVSTALQGIRGLRLLRLARLLPLIVGARVSRNMFTLAGLRYAAMTAGLVILVGGVAFAAVEDGHHAQTVSTWDGVWWAISTATTVGYGDLYPVTTSGRFIAIGVMAAGIGFVGFFTAAIAQRFIVPAVAEDIERMEEHQHSDDAVLIRQLAAMRVQIEEIEQTLLRRAGSPPRR